MIAPFRSPTQRRLLYGFAVSVVITFAIVGVMTKAGRLRSEPPVAGFTQFSAPASLPEKPLGQMSLKARLNPIYSRAPAPGSAYFRALTFRELDDEQNSSPGSRAARELLVRTNKGNVTAAEAQYSGSAKQGFDEYQRAVFLNTVACIQQRDGRLLEDATFVRFYDGKKKLGLEYGIILSGITSEKLDQAKMGLAGLLGFMGRRSPRADAVASLEAAPALTGTNLYAFDVDLYNFKSDADKHVAETDFNDENSAATHPADVARALRLRGILSGVTTK
jgi:hypothetical protein